MKVNSGCLKPTSLIVLFSFFCYFLCTDCHLSYERSSALFTASTLWRQPDYASVMEPRTGLECNACSKQLIGNCFMTACGHILCHDDGMSAFRNNHDFVCPVCDKTLTREGVTELNFLGDNPASTNDVKTILSFIVERPGTVLGFLGQVLQFREQQRLLIISSRKRLKRNAEKDANDLKHKIMRTENYAQEMEGKLRRKDARIQELEKEFAETRRQRDALQKSYRALREERVVPPPNPSSRPLQDRARGRDAHFAPPGARNHYTPGGGIPLPLTPSVRSLGIKPSPYSNPFGSRVGNSPVPSYKRSPANTPQNSAYFSNRQDPKVHHAGARYRQSRSRSNSPAKLTSAPSTPRFQRPGSADARSLRSPGGGVPARRTPNSRPFQLPMRPKTPLFNQLQARSNERHTGWS